MTLPVTSRRDGPYSCNGSLVDFDFNFKVFAEGDIEVILADADGVETTLVLTTDYTVALNADQENNPGGTITTVATYATGNTITIVGALDYGQTAELTNRGGFFPKVIERALDRLGILIQQLKELIDRSVTLPASSSGVSAELPAPSAGLVLGWNSAETALENKASAGVIGVSAFAETLLDDTSAGAARTTLGVDTLDAANVKLTGDQTVAGVKTFSSTPVLPAIGNGLVPTGTVLDFAGTAAPTGFLGCDGAAVSRTTYAALFTAISTTWGVGDGATTFNVPNFQRRVAVGSGGSGTATLANTVGSTGGAETHTLLTAEMPAHTHDVTAFASGGSYAAASNIAGSQTITSTSTGGGGAHNNMQPSAVVLKIIKT